VCPTLYTFASLPSREVGAPERSDPRLAYLPAERRAMLASMVAAEPQDSAGARSRLAVLRARQQLVRSLHAGGVTLLAGTDYAQYPLVFPGFTLHDELHQLVVAGLSPLEALRTATHNVGHYLGDATVGCLGVGCRADAVFLAANPLDDIRHPTEVRAVLVRGQYLAAAAREERLEGLRAAASRQSGRLLNAPIDER
jgi:imidazolonepropionase-like amidohydrolase